MDFCGGESDTDEGDMDFRDININDATRDIEGKCHSGFVSGWSDDDVQEEEIPHESIEKEILWAAENGDMKIMQKLLEPNTNFTKIVDRDGYTPLHRAAYNDHLKMLEFLLERGADINAETVDGWTPLHSACHWNSVSCAERLISLGVDVNRKSQGGITPLHLAASNNQGIETLQVLLWQPDIDTTVTNRSHETAHEIALRKNKFTRFFEIVEPCFNYI